MARAAKRAAPISVGIQQMDLGHIPPRELGIDRGTALTATCTSNAELPDNRDARSYLVLQLPRPDPADARRTRRVFAREDPDLPSLGRKGGLLRDSIVDFESFRPVSTEWPASIGMGGRLPSESVAGLRRNQ